MVSQILLAIVLSLTNAAAIVVPAFDQAPASCLSRPSKNRSTNINADDDSYRIKFKAADCTGEVRIDGKLRFNDDFTRLVGIDRGGVLRIDENDGDTRRVLEVTSGSNGLEYSWSVNGRERAFDAQGRAYLDAWTLVLFRELGYAAEERATYLVNNKGVAGVLSEVALMKSDYVQAEYLGVAMEKGKLSEADVQRVLGVAAETLDSDYYMSNVLAGAARGVEFSSESRRNYLTAVGTMESDYYKEGALRALLEKGRMTSAEMAIVLREATTIDSDYYRSTLLSSVADRNTMDGTLRSAYLEAVKGIESDYYRAESLKQLLDRSGITDSELVDIIGTARTIKSDYYLTEVLSNVASGRTLSGNARTAYMDAAGSIKSSHYRNSAEAALRRSR